MKNLIIILMRIFLVLVVILAFSFFPLLIIYPINISSIDFIFEEIHFSIYRGIVNSISFVFPGYFAEFIIPHPIDDAQSIKTADFDGDGDQDVLAIATETNILAWWRNNGKKFLRGITFTKFVIGTHPGIYDIDIADIDGDGDKDILGVGHTIFSPTRGLAWWRNDGNDPVTKDIVFTKLLIDNNGFNSVHAVDFDKDGDQDILGMVNRGSIVWWRNDGNGNFTRIIIGREDNAHIVYAADFDGDGDYDVLSADLGVIAWWKNNGRGNFTKYIIRHAGYVGFIWDIHIADIDGDGSNDFLVADRARNTIAWWKNNGQGNFTEIVIEKHFDRATSVSAADFNKDGDLDIVATNRGELMQYIAWWRNEGNGNFTKFIVDDKCLGGAYGVYTADIDGDGDKDIIAGVAWTNALTWWKNNLEN